MTAQSTQNIMATSAEAARANPEPQPLAWGRHCDVFALRLRDRPPQPPTRLFEFLDLNAGDYLSNTTLKVIDALMSGDLSRIRSETLADSLRISPTTLRRRLGRDNLNYQSILDATRRYRCEEKLADSWVPGKCLAWELGYAEVNSFYRAFRRWTGRNYSELKLLLI